MKEKETVIEDITVGRTRGLFGRPDAVMMVIDLKDKAGFDTRSTAGRTSALRKKAGEAFDMQSADMPKYEY